MTCAPSADCTVLGGFLAAMALGLLLWTGVFWMLGCLL